MCNIGRLSQCKHDRCIYKVILDVVSQLQLHIIPTIYLTSHFATIYNDQTVFIFLHVLIYLKRLHFACEFCRFQNCLFVTNHFLSVFWSKPFHMNVGKERFKIAFFVTNHFLSVFWSNIWMQEKNECQPLKILTVYIILGHIKI